MRKPALLLTLLAFTAAPHALAQSPAAAVPSAPGSVADTLAVQLPPATLTTAVADPALSPLEAEACRRLLAEAQIDRDVAVAPPAPAVEEKAPTTRVQGVGAITGSVMGQVAGAAVAGPVGAALGALVVAKVGQSLAGGAEKALTSDEKKAKVDAAALAAAEPTTTPGPVPELVSECEARAPAEAEPVSLAAPST